ncbi:MAG: hypothetical protein BEN19_08255 [Epulopiscium sp. Nuni2H_MBin003]|nr:MAG: hypothetical protein BEN19_08255 [Epulopiscium sp. Nuni2H_MBin003]
MAYDNKNPTIIPDISDDGQIFEYVRYRTLELLKGQIELYNVTGELAAFGVYKGGLAQKLNTLFPNRKLYLFDTFNVFEDKELFGDIDEMGSDIDDPEYQQYLKDISSTTILEEMPHKEKCVIKQGYFPNSLKGLEEIFALVSLDTGLYDDTYRGLWYFYPRLSQGGYIIINSYTNLNLGVKRAITDYENKFGKLAKIPIPDLGGSIIITKS